MTLDCDAQSNGDWYESPEYVDSSFVSKEEDFLQATSGMLEADCEGDDKEVIMEARNTPNKLSNAEQPVTSLDGEDNFNSLQLIDLLEALSGAPLGAELLVCTDDDSPQLQEPLPNDRNLNSPASSGYQSGDDPSWFSYPDISEEPPSPPDVHEAVEPSASVESVDISSQPDDPVPATSAKANSKGQTSWQLYPPQLWNKDELQEYLKWISQTYEIAIPLDRFAVDGHEICYWQYPEFLERSERAGTIIYVNLVSVSQDWINVLYTYCEYCSVFHEDFSGIECDNSLLAVQEPPFPDISLDVDDVMDIELADLVPRRFCQVTAKVMPYYCSLKIYSKDRKKKYRRESTSSSLPECDPSTSELVSDNDAEPVSQTDSDNPRDSPDDHVFSYDSLCKSELDGPPEKKQCLETSINGSMHSPQSLIPNGFYSSRLIPPPNGFITSRYNGYPLPPPLQPIFARLDSLPPLAAYMPRDFPTEPRDFHRRSMYTDKGEFRRERTMNLQRDLREYPRDPEYEKDFRKLQPEEPGDLKRETLCFPRDFRGLPAYRDEGELTKGLRERDLENESRREPMESRREPTVYRNDLRTRARGPREMSSDFDRNYREFERDNRSKEMDSRELARELLDFHREAREREYVRMQMELQTHREMMQDFNENSRHANHNSKVIRQQNRTPDREDRNKTRDSHEIYPREYFPFTSPPRELAPTRAPPTVAPTSVIRNAMSSSGNHVSHNGLSLVSRSNTAPVPRVTLPPVSRTDDSKVSHHDARKQCGDRLLHSNTSKLPQVLSPPPEAARKEVLPPKERLKKDLRKELAGMSDKLWSIVPSPVEIPMDDVSSPSPSSSLSAKEDETESEMEDRATPTPPRSPITIKLKIDSNGKASLKRRQSSSSTDSGTEDVKDDRAPRACPPNKLTTVRSRVGRRKGTASRSLHLWEFLKELLENDEYCPRYITWVSRDEGIFRLVNSAAVAKLWGQRKNRRSMNYEKMSRALRYYYERKILERVPGQRLIYKFAPDTMKECNFSFMQNKDIATM